MASQDRTHCNWRERFLTPLIELAIMGAAVGLSYILMLQCRFHLLAFFLVFYFVSVLLTFVTLKIIRMLCPMRRGIYSYETSPWVFYCWRLHSFLCSTNLSFQYNNGLLPPFLRKYFYCLLGANIGKGATTIGGRLLDPYMITIHDTTRLGDDVLLIPHGYAIGSSDILILDNIELGKGAVVGPRTTLMPGVVLGENSMVKAMSIVAMNTKIPSNEIWGGIPAKKVADIDKPFSEAI